MATTENLELYEIGVLAWHVTKEPNEAGGAAEGAIGLTPKGGELTVLVYVGDAVLKCRLKTFTRTRIPLD
jgi:hypothetical protein